MTRGVTSHHFLFSKLVKKLKKYLEDGRLEISNNAGERAIRPICNRKRKLAVL